MLGPVVGLLVTVAGLIVAFDAVGRADPATKSQQLAEGISEAMNATAFGLVVFPIGAILTGVALFQLLRRRPSGGAEKTEQPPAPPHR